MVNPSLEVLLSKVDNKYTLAVLAAKRAREILEGHEGARDGETLTDEQQLKPVSTALYEIAQGKVTYKRTKAGIK